MSRSPKSFVDYLDWHHADAFQSRFVCPLAVKSGQIHLKLNAFSGTYRT
jgi:hypothetical protein